jgi:hypothetical protein
VSVAVIVDEFVAAPSVFNASSSHHTTANVSVDADGQGATLTASGHAIRIVIGQASVCPGAFVNVTPIDLLPPQNPTPGLLRVDVVGACMLARFSGSRCFVDVVTGHCFFFLCCIATPRHPITTIRFMHDDSSYYDIYNAATTTTAAPSPNECIRLVTLVGVDPDPTLPVQQLAAWAASGPLARSGAAFRPALAR